MSPGPPAGLPPGMPGAPPGPPPGIREGFGPSRPVPEPYSDGAFQPAPYRSRSASKRRSRLGRLRRRLRRRQQARPGGIRETVGSSAIQNILVVLALLVVAAVAVRVSDARPSGLDVVDELWVGGFAAVVAFFAGYGRRWTWFVPAGVGAVLAADKLALACAAVAIVFGMASVVIDRRSRPFAVLVAGAGMAALLQTNSVGFHGVNSIVVAVVVLPMVVSGYKLVNRASKRIIRLVAAWAGAVAFLMVGAAGVGVALVAGDLVDGAKMIDKGIASARDADTEATQEHMGEATRHLQSADATLTSWFVQPAHALPFVGPNIRAVSEMARDTAEATTATEATAALADLDNLKFEDGRLDPNRISILIPSLTDVAESAGTTQETVDRVESPWLVEPVARRMNDLSEEVDGSLPEVERAVDALEVAVPLIGGEEDRRYLVLFTTPSESRGRTGFPGNYAELTFKDGKLEMPEFGRISELEQGGDPTSRAITDQDEYLDRYGRFNPETTWRNITMSPDFPTVAQVARQLYGQSGFEEGLDGVLSVDPTGLAALMQFTGPVTLDDGSELTADNVASFLHLEQYLNYDVNDERVDFLGDVAEQVFRQLTELDMGDTTPSEAIEILGEATAGNHIQLTTRFPDEAEYLNTVGVDGALAPAAGDALAVTTTNIGPNKIDAFLNRHLAYDVTWDPGTGSVTGTVKATLTNRAPVSSDLPDYVVGNGEDDLPRGYNRSYVSIYSPWALSSGRIDGEEAGLHPERELDRYVYATYVDIPPGESVTIELDLSGEWAAPYYPLALSPAPLVSEEELSVSVTVAGDDDLTVGANDEGWTVEDRTIRYDGVLDRPLALAAALGDAEDVLTASDDLVIIDD